MKIYIILMVLMFFILTGCENTLVKNEIKYTNKKVNSTNDTPYFSNNDSLNQFSDKNSNVTSMENITSFYTKIYDSSEGRMNNLRIAANKLSNIRVKSGEVFSFNDSIGPYNKENGYEKGKIFDSKGNVLEEYGGGICQISSTLYNAVLNLNLEIIERNDHSKKVQYVEPGKDAAISYGHLDFKFRNTLNYDIIIQCKVENNKVIVDIQKESSQ